MYIFNSLRKKLLFSILPILIISIYLLSFYHAKNTKKYLLEEYRVTQNQTENEIISYIYLIDSAYKMFEKKLNEELNKDILKFVNEYNKSSKDISKINLIEVSKYFKNKYDFYIIDENTTVIKSTENKALNFNFKKFNKKLGENIDFIRKNGKIYNERLRTNVMSGFLSTWVYKSTPDKKYLFELGYTANGLKDFINDLDPLNIIDKLKKINPIIKDIKIYDVFGYQFVSNGQNYAPTKKSKEIVELAKKYTKYTKEDNEYIENIIYINLNTGFNISDHSKIIAIQYDKSFINKRLKELNQFTYFAITISVIISIFIISIISFFVTHSLKKLKFISHELSNGNFNIKADIKSNDEIGDFAKTFNIMTAKLNDSFNQIKEQNKRIEEYNLTLEEKVKERTKEIRIKNEKIVSSVRYARKIQNYILPSKKFLKENFKDFFIIWQPKDVVGGDFYFGKKIEEIIYFAVIDCTGHGVPGAFMTMATSSFLNELITKEISPSEILNGLNHRIKTYFNKNSQKISDDGLDISLIKYNSVSKKSIFVGTKLSMYLSKNGVIKTFKGDRQSIGYIKSKDHYDYTEYKFDATSDTIIYLSTDGYTDQNGGPKNFGYSKKRLINDLDQIAHKPLDEQKKIIIENLKKWKGKETQRDDITLIGIKFK
ncbi:serine phosphatase RsbU (regulator of sigma subunit) [Hypnocyclicus thermotrophus]|uniref:Serine phosphatase RsbU (Regulator of sigma subunit) n=1 Tax=Hypnocyclicus thermotrophus TaxID=1627895 RepID=A0AA46I4T1_9FUSO|nr:SpoIIE family protein phosphatase [Hypnocyclicus thermotrophus]TDT67362.1 serine phosphatase RsbU (regulator of sigma subunit) [Hypnocyclicus thermotrophus]